MLHVLVPWSWNTVWLWLHSTANIFPKVLVAQHCILLTQLPGWFLAEMMAEESGLCSSRHGAGSVQVVHLSRGAGMDHLVLDTSRGGVLMPDC